MVIIRLFPAGMNSLKKELITVATKTDKPGKKTKRLSKSKRMHVRRLKQEARKTAGTTPAHA
jgi:hypothetical protein